MMKQSVDQSPVEITGRRVDYQAGRLGASYVKITPKMLLDACWITLKPHPDSLGLNQRSL